MNFPYVALNSLIYILLKTDVWQPLRKLDIPYFIVHWWVVTRLIYQIIRTLVSLRNVNYTTWTDQICTRIFFQRGKDKK